jgi:gliding motility-associated lipoprotein GldH
MKKSLNLFILSCFASLLLSCDDKQVFDSYQSVGKTWHRDSIVTFEYEVKDTTEHYDLFLNLRANDQYPFSNIFLIASIESPAQKVKTDTLEYLMAAPDGKILGNGFSDIKESKLWYKDNYRFTEMGVHTIRVEQALRKRNEIEGLDELDGIIDVGFRIEKVK